MPLRLGVLPAAAACFASSAVAGFMRYTDTTNDTRLSAGTGGPGTHPSSAERASWSMTSGRMKVRLCQIALFHSRLEITCSTVPSEATFRVVSVHTPSSPVYTGPGATSASDGTYIRLT